MLISVIERGEIMLILHLYWLAFSVLEGDMHANTVEKESLLLPTCELQKLQEGPC